MASLYPLPTKELLRKEFVHKSLKDVQTPSAVLDLHLVKENCEHMLKAVDALGLGWRAHIKTHKTSELTHLQLGDGSDPADVVVSTLIEAENIVPVLKEHQSKNRPVNLLYSFPVTPSIVGRLSVIAAELGPGGISVMVDHPEQLPFVERIKEKSGNAPKVFIKVDMGSHRAGVPPFSPILSEIISSALKLESKGSVILYGLYSHAGHSYYQHSKAAAVDLLRQEFEALLVTAETVHEASPSTPLVLSVGATPTTTSIYNVLAANEHTPEEESMAIAALQGTINTLKERNCHLEIHAGVYTTLDIQQLATHSAPSEGPSAMLTWSNLAFTIVAEVASIYSERGPNDTPEVLLGLGSIGLGREPCKAYAGWGILSPWNIDNAKMPISGPEDHEGWQVSRISQEHGILTWNGNKENVKPLKIGQKVRVWPNHSCIAGAGHDWYLIVDSSRTGKEDEIIDVWVRWRGW
ncbi:putative serine dehydratase domain-containing protein [Xylogone sp. PMI_703]|nr:putative serine dehydratase domain-containing protein [Xylogone sp. PMI_703]